MLYKPPASDDDAASVFFELANAKWVADTVCRF